MHSPSTVEPPRQTIPGRFTRDGSAALENRLQNICFEVVDAICGIVPQNLLEGLLLGGGYGRGEGGVKRTAKGDLPYNDLEFYIAIKGHPRKNEWIYSRVFDQFSQRMSQQTGIEVEFKIFSLARLRNEPVTMFTYDLVMGHKRILGEASMLAGCEHHQDAGRIPLSEAIRLLMNRCSGLLYSLQRLESPSINKADADFIGRNIAKAELAYGDALLTANSQYHWSCLERDRWLMNLPQLDRLPPISEIQRIHQNAVEFKLHPEQTPPDREALEEHLAYTIFLGKPIWLWLESQRLQHDFRTIDDYSHSRIDKCPETPAWRNAVINLVSQGPSLLLSGDLFRYPRERLLMSIANLLWGNRESSGPRASRNSDGLIWEMGQYQELWHRFR